MKHTRPYQGAARAMGALGQQPEDASPPDIGLLSGFPVGQVAQLVVLLDDLRETVPPSTNVTQSLWGVQTAMPAAGSFAAFSISNPRGCWVRFIQAIQSARFFVPDFGAIPILNPVVQAPTTIRGGPLNLTITSGDIGAVSPLLLPGGLPLRANRAAMPAFFLPPGVGLLCAAEAAATAIDGCALDLVEPPA